MSTIRQLKMAAQRADQTHIPVGTGVRIVERSNTRTGWMRGDSKGRDASGNTNVSRALPKLKRKRDVSNTDSSGPSPLGSETQQTKRVAYGLSDPTRVVWFP